VRARLRAIPLELRKVGAVLGIALVLGASFVAAYTIALGRPVPRHLPVGVVGDASPQLLADLQQRSHEFEPYDYPSRAAAVQAVDRQEITAVIDTSAAPPELLISSASDPSSARVLTQIDQADGQPALKIVDLHPLPAADPAGLATFYLIIAATILGFVTMFQLRANVKTLTLGRWLGCLAVLAVVGGATLAAVAGPVLGALSTPFPVLWGLVSVQIGVAAMFNSAMLVMIHRWAIIPTWLVFILLGNTSSGGAVSATLLPQPFSFLNHALPSGAAVSAVHSATYFPDHQRPGPYVVLAVWLIASTAVLLVASRRLQRSPAQA
jgi:hypothetical protein